MRLVLAEDHALLRAGMIQLLESNGFTVLHAVADGDALTEALRDPDADAAVVDVRLPPSQTDEGLRAAIAARVSRIVFGAFDDKAGACGSVWDLPRDRGSLHRPEVYSGVLAAECTDRLSDFFAARR